MNIRTTKVQNRQTACYYRQKAIKTLIYRYALTIE